MKVHDWLLTPVRAALHVPTGTVVVSDLHLGFGRSRQVAGDAVPEVSVASVLAPLATLKDHGATRLLIAGDLFESGYRRAVADQLTAWCQSVGLELLGLVPGNHDRNLVDREDLPLFGDGYPLGEWLVVHGDGDLPERPILHGHDHPCLRLSGRVQAPCYLVSERRIVLPAFSRDAAGVGVVGLPRWRGFRCLAIVGSEILDFGDACELVQHLKGRDPAREDSHRVEASSRSSELGLPHRSSQ
jgi:putative SbcD/Mre11-related phosphoesterase